jgi:monooxygenase
MTPARPAHKPGAEADRADPAEVDVAIVGAGISGVCAAHHLQQAGRDFLVLEARERVGGTWDLFRYPGIRSDSDMHTLGFPFRPWTGSHAIADGPEIRRYVTDTARVLDLERHIRFGCRVTAAAWSSEEQRWTLELAGGETVRCRFLFGCTGYYSYEQPYTPLLPGLERFAGTVIHPQRWPEELPVAERRVVVIGSGATAVSLVPALAARGARVTMLQRSPAGGPAGPVAARAAAGGARPPPGALEERPAHAGELQAQPPCPAADAPPARAGRGAGAAGGLRRGTPLQSPL